MTVMLLQRSATPQLTHIQKTANQSSEQAPFLFLLDVQENGAGSSQATESRPRNSSNALLRNYGYTSSNSASNSHAINSSSSSNSNNNNNNNNNAGRSSGGSRGNVATVRVEAAEAQGHPVQGVAMRYYRLWIYACNIVLLGSAVGFTTAVSRTLVFSNDPRRHLVPGVPRLLDPTSLYGYLALGIQLGLVQLLGCIAARRLSAKLLNAYWVLLLALLFGDAVTGVAWIFRIEKIRTELRPTLKLRLQMDYDKDSRFSEHWDRLQRDFACCGMTGSRDFGLRWPQTCCGGAAAAAGPPSGNASEIICQQPYANGCEEFLVRWMRKTADLLFVLGFCVIAFTKLCFLGILRYEIREMIQKIHLLKEPPPPPTPFMQSLLQQVVPQDSTNNGNVARRKTLPSNIERASFLVQQSDECSDKRQHLMANSLQQQHDGGADSDTNSHCALILEETTPTSLHKCTSSEKSNGNNNYEMREFNRKLLMSNGGGNAAMATNASHSKRT